MLAGWVYPLSRWSHPVVSVQMSCTETIPPSSILQLRPLHSPPKYPTAYPIRTRNQHLKFNLSKPKLDSHPQFFLFWMLTPFFQMLRTKRLASLWNHSFTSFNTSANPVVFTLISTHLHNYHPRPSHYLTQKYSLDTVVLFAFTLLPSSHNDPFWSDQVTFLLWDLLWLSFMIQFPLSILGPAYWPPCPQNMSSTLQTLHLLCLECSAPRYPHSLFPCFQVPIRLSYYKGLPRPPYVKVLSPLYCSLCNKA